MKAKIGRYTAENGNKAAITKFSADLLFTLHESTVRSFKRAYFEKLKDPDAITALQSKPHEGLQPYRSTRRIR